MKTIIFFPVFLFALHVFSQQTIPATGGDASGASGSVSYTVGQIVYSSNSGSNGSEHQGVQQPYEISVITNLDELPEITLEILAFPNPTDGNLVLSIASLPFESAYCRISDLNGKHLFETKLIQENTDIHMQNYPAGVYLLQVFINTNTTKVFKIIKH
jgi:hypothetical protein